MEKSDKAETLEPDNDSSDKDIIPQEEPSLEAKKTKLAEEPLEDTLEVRRRLHEFRRMEAYLGPLPPPDILRQFDEIVPGSASRIIDQFTFQGDHRRELEKFVIQGDVKRANWGLISGVLLGTIGITGSLILIGLGKEVGGIIALLTTLSPIVLSLIYVNTRRREERALKANVVPESHVGKQDSDVT